MIRHWHSRWAVAPQKPLSMQRKPAAPQDALGSLPTQEAALQKPQPPVCRGCAGLRKGRKPAAAEAMPSARGWAVASDKAGRSARGQTGPEVVRAVSRDWGGAAATTGAGDAAGRPDARVREAGTRRIAARNRTMRGLTVIASSLSQVSVR